MIVASLEVRKNDLSQSKDMDAFPSQAVLLGILLGMCLLFALSRGISHRMDDLAAERAIDGSRVLVRRAPNPKSSDIRLTFSDLVRSTQVWGPQPLTPQVVLVPRGKRDSGYRFPSSDVEISSPKCLT